MWWEYKTNEQTCYYNLQFNKEIVKYANKNIEWKVCKRNKEYEKWDHQVIMDAMLLD